MAGFVTTDGRTEIGSKVEKAPSKKRNAKATPVKPMPPLQTMPPLREEPHDLTDEELLIKSLLGLLKETLRDLRDVDEGICYHCNTIDSHKQSCRVYKIVKASLEYMASRNINIDLD